jgi:N-methylhydantoinase A/oxoprolinase/acetone carboxylase beta subunit
MKIGIGIDTGGTCTDAVAYDLEGRKVLASAKSLTTKEHLAEGIIASLAKLPAELVQQAKSISLSTTLATNACVEGKGGRARLFIYGADEEYIMRLGCKSGEYTKEDLYCIDTETEFDGTIHKMPDWDEIKKMIDECDDCDAIATVEIYSKQTGAQLEKKTKQMVTQQLNIPAICGYELFKDLNFIRRGGSALLNARLVPLIDEFLKAVDQSLEQNHIDREPAIVRSDGTLMSREFAKYRPVETLLCGPVASVMGAKELADTENAIVVDMGGTTTDVAFVKNGIPVRAEDGVQIGNWRTFVKGLYVETFGLGGDSAVRYNSKGMYLDETRVIPTCILASEYPFIVEELKALDDSLMYNTRWLHEYYVLQNSIDDKKGYSEEEHRICEILKDGPKSTGALAKAMGMEVYYLDLSTQKLEREGVIMRSGLTPTDIMHIKGDYNAYNKEASYHAAAFVGRYLGLTAQQLGDKVYDAVKKKMYCHLGEILLKRQFSEFRRNGVREQVQYLLEQSWEQNKLGAEKSFDIALHWEVPATFVGIGGPIHIFLDDVAKAFGSKAVIPPHAEVANAVGAVISHISFEIEVSIHPFYNSTGKVYYMVYSHGDSKKFSARAFEDACSYAEERLEICIQEEAKQRGIQGRPDVTKDRFEVYYEGTDILEDVFYKALVRENE